MPKRSPTASAAGIAAHPGCDCDGRWESSVSARWRGASGMRWRWRMGIVGLVRVREDAVGQRRLDGAAPDGRTRDSAEWVAAERLAELDGEPPGRPRGTRPP